MDRHRQQCHSEGQIAVAPLSLIAVKSRNLMVAHPVLAQPFISVGGQRHEKEPSRGFARQRSAE
jgi:hypothetical protein